MILRKTKGEHILGTTNKQPESDRGGARIKFGFYCAGLPLTEIYDGAIEGGEGELILGAVTIVETRTDGDGRRAVVA